MRSEDEPVNFEEVARLQNLDEQIDRRLSGNTPSQPNGTDALDADLLRHLHNFYQPHGQAFQQGLNRVWGRLEQRSPALARPRQRPDDPTTRPGPSQQRISPMSQIFHTGHRWASRASVLITAALLVVLVGGLTLGLILVRHNGSSPTGSSPNQGQGNTGTTPFSVSSVDLSVSPDSIAGMPCGSAVSFTYTATFHIPAGTAGGTIQFQYTLNNGRSSTPASVTVSAGETTKTSTFTSSGTLPPDHTYPGIAEVMVTSPNAVNSPQVQPSGSCTAVSAFQVTSVDMAVSPASITGRTCGTPLTVTYTATFHIAPNGPGGTIQFQYTINNGRGSTPANLTVAAGQTTATYSFQWSGTLPPDHTYPGNGGVIVTSPNQITSALVAPTGQCS